MNAIVFFIISWLVVFILVKPMYKFLYRHFPLAHQNHQKKLWMMEFIAFGFTLIFPPVLLLFWLTFNSIPLWIRIALFAYIVNWAILFLTCDHFEQSEQKKGTLVRRTIFGWEQKK